MSRCFRLGWDCEQQQKVQISCEDLVQEEEAGANLREASGQCHHHQGGCGEGRTSLKYAEADQEFSYLPAEER